MQTAPAKPQRAKPDQTAGRPARLRPGAARTPMRQPASGGPRLRDGFVPRQRLVRRLVEDRDASLVVIAAPAGYGKTTLLAQWSAWDERRFAWAELGEGENEPDRLLGSLAEAVGELERAGAHTLAEPRVLPARRGRLAQLLACLRAVRGGAVLALDGFERIHSPESLDLVARLAAAMPAGTKLALASRTLPAIALGRLRAEGAL